MKLSQRKLKQIIKEEIQKALREQRGADKPVGRGLPDFVRRDLDRPLPLGRGGTQSARRRSIKQRRPRRSFRPPQHYDKAAEIAKVVDNVVKQLNDILIRLKGGP